MQILSAKQRDRILYWYPAGIAAGITGATYAFVGNTPLLRAIALAMVIAGVTIILRQLGTFIAIVGGTALGFSPAFWSQTGGTLTTNPPLVISLMVVASLIALGVLIFRKPVFASFIVGTVLFVGLYLLFGATERSLRLTNILAAWLLYMLVIALRKTNPRPEEPPAIHLSTRHIIGVLVMFVLGTLNDPLFVLFAPAVIFGLWLSHVRLSWWYWMTLIGIFAIGVWGVYSEYISSIWTFSDSTNITQVHIPFLILNAWRNPARWIQLMVIIIEQFTWVGIILGIIGIARMARWYPTLGIMLMVAYGSYALFGLVYFGEDIAILLLPLIMIQAICITYAVYTIGQWASAKQTRPIYQWLVTAAFTTLPLILLLRIVGTN